MIPDDLKRYIEQHVALALQEDVRGGDVSAALVDADSINGATVVAREPLVLAGEPFANEVFRQLDDSVIVDWYVGDTERADAGDVICKLVGPSRAILSGERTALNYLQTLSATATITAQYADAVAGTNARVLDTRKTIPGLRLAQKYAVRCGGGFNHREGLFDAVLIKENHLRTIGSIQAAIEAANAQHPELLIQIEVETLDELQEALDAGATRVLLDNFTVSDVERAVAMNATYGIVAAALEVSGNMSLETIRSYAETGVDYISVGALTKNIQAVDLSMLFRID